MNYRHAFHAGNFADVVKHATLARIITYLKKKPAPFRVIDTHAGVGVYDLDADEAARTGEWKDGISRVMAADAPDRVAGILEPYLDVVSAMNESGDLRRYPGSPELAKRLVRQEDRMTLVELHPQDADRLRQRYHRNKTIKTVELDGWLALGAFVPPKEKRGLVLIDPAFEAADEFTRLADGVTGAYDRWPTGVYCAWYPVKDLRRVQRLHGALSATAMRRILRVEMQVADPKPDGSLAACGMLIVNPPFTLHDELATLLPWLTDTMTRGPGAGFRLDWLVGE